VVSVLFWPPTTSLPFFPQLDINDMTKSWGLEVDRVELTMEAVLQPPRDALLGPLGAIAPALEGAPPQLAAHLLNSTPSAPEAGRSP